jgi:hypothetical protein
MQGSKDKKPWLRIIQVSSGALALAGRSACPPNPELACHYESAPGVHGSLQARATLVEAPQQQHALQQFERGAMS